MFWLEIKRLIKTRSVAVLAVTALAASAFFAYSVVRSAGSMDARGFITLRGMEAIKYQQEIYADVEGYVTPELISEFDCLSKEYREVYGSPFDMPPEVYDEWISYEPILSAVSSVTNSGYEVEDYYDARKDVLHSLGSYINESVARLALWLDTGAEEPFYWEYGFGSGEYGYCWTICLFVICLICVIIASPAFSQDYATDADSIQRCTKLGREQLAKVKMGSVFAFCTSLYFVCAVIFCGILLLTLGPDSSAVQFKLGWGALTGMNMNEALALCTLSGLLTMLASISLTMWVSSMQPNTVMVLVISAAALALPMFADHYLDYPVSDWIRLLLPGGGTGLQNSMYYELPDFKFLTVGSLAIWTPFVMLAAPVIETPVFALLAKRAYVRHECS